MKKLVNTITLITFSLLSISATISASDTLKISIDWENELNKSHVYKDIFSQKDNSYISWLYLTAKKIEVLDPIEYSKTRRRNSRDGNAPLIFTIQEDNTVRYEKVRNAVHPSEREYSKPKFKDNFGSNIPKAEGTLPKGTIVWTSDENKKRSVGIEWAGEPRDVKIEILDLDEKVLHIMEDQNLPAGNYTYLWNGKNHKVGDYILRYTMDGEVLSQTIHLEDDFGSWISRLLNRIF